jgi:hypothetical protein
MDDDDDDECDRQACEKRENENDENGGSRRASEMGARLSMMFEHNELINNRLSGLAEQIGSGSLQRNSIDASSSLHRNSIDATSSFHRNSIDATSSHEASASSGYVASFTQPVVPADDNAEDGDQSTSQHTMTSQKSLVSPTVTSSSNATIAEKPMVSGGSTHSASSRYGGAVSEHEWSEELRRIEREVQKSIRGSRVVLAMSETSDSEEDSGDSEQWEDQDAHHRQCASLPLQATMSARDIVMLTKQNEALRFRIAELEAENAALRAGAAYGGGGIRARKKKVQMPASSDVEYVPARRQTKMSKKVRWKQDSDEEQSSYHRYNSAERGSNRRASADEMADQAQNIVVSLLDTLEAYATAPAEMYPPRSQYEAIPENTKSVLGDLRDAIGGFFSGLAGD